MRLVWMFFLILFVTTAFADELLWEQLKQDPNMIVLMRNAESVGNKDGTNMLIWDASGNCKGESTLTVEGKAQAKAIGDAFSEHGIRPVVISSPMCRCTETAQIAFGDFITDPDLRQRPVTDESGQEVFMTRASALLKQHRGKAPVVFVNHRPNIDLLTMELLGIGELLVGRITEEGEIEVIGNIRIES
jgi:phosphohistidine phosphatase SixA